MTTGHFTYWRKSSFSHPDGNCVEVAQAGDGTVGVRDSKGDFNIILELTPREWSAFLTSLREIEA